VKPLFALTAVLVGVLGWESLPEADYPVGVAPLVAPVAGVVPAVVVAPVAAWTDAVLARPLFARDRRPVAHEAGVRSSGGVQDVLPRLAGTVRSSDGLVAIFVPGGSAPVDAAPGGSGVKAVPGEKPVVVGRAGMVAAWTVVDITDGSATLERDGRTVTVNLSFSNAPAEAHVVAPQALVLLHDKRTSPFLQP
jgi:hypothetical protein